MVLPFGLYKWIQTFDFGAPIVSVARDMASGYLLAQLLSKYYPAVFEMRTFVNQTSETVRDHNWARIMELLPQTPLRFTQQEVEGAKRASEPHTQAILQKIHHQVTGKRVAAASPPRAAEAPVAPVSPRRPRAEARPSNITIQGTAPVVADPLKFLTTRNLDNIRSIARDGGGVKLSPTAYTAPPGTQPSAFSSDQKAPQHTSQYPQNVPMFVRGSYVHARKLIDVLSTACRHALNVTEGLESFLDMMDPRVDAYCPFPDICMRIPVQAAPYLFENLLAELRSFSASLADHVVASPESFWDILRLVVQSAVNLKRICGAQAPYPGLAVAFLSDLIAGVSARAPDVSASLYENVVTTRLVKVLDVSFFSLHSFCALLLSFTRMHAAYVGGSLPAAEALVASVVHLLTHNIVLSTRTGRGADLYGVELSVLAALFAAASTVLQPQGSSIREHPLLSTGAAGASSPAGRAAAADAADAGPLDEDAPGSHADGAPSRSRLSQTFDLVIQAIIRRLSSAHMHPPRDKLVALDILVRICAASPSAYIPQCEPAMLRLLADLLNQQNEFSLSEQCRAATGRSALSPIHALVRKRVYALSIAPGVPRFLAGHGGDTAGGASPCPSKDSEASTDDDAGQARRSDVPQDAHGECALASLAGTLQALPALHAHGRASLADAIEVLYAPPPPGEKADGHASGRVGYSLSVTIKYDNIPYMNYEALLFIVVALRAFSSHALSASVGSPLLAVSADLEDAVVRLAPLCSPILLLLGAMCRVSRYLDEFQRITFEGGAEFLASKEHADSARAARHFAAMLLDNQAYLDVILSAVDGRADLDTADLPAALSFPQHCYYKVVASLYPGSTLDEVLEAVIVTFAGQPVPAEPEAFALFARFLGQLLRRMPGAALHVYTRLADSVYVQACEPANREHASFLLCVLLGELKGRVPDADVEASMHALLDYAMQSDSPAVGEAALEFLQEAGEIPWVRGCLHDMLIKLEVEDYGSEAFGAFIREILDAEGA